MRILIVSENGLFGESIKALLNRARPESSIRTFSCREATQDAIGAYRPDVVVVVMEGGGKDLETHCLSLIHTLELRVILCTLEGNTITVLKPRHLVDAGVDGLVTAVCGDERE